MSLDFTVNAAVEQTGRVLPDTHRLQHVEIGRFAASIAIVWIHSAESTAGKWLVPACRFAVPFFTVAVVCFSLRHVERSLSERPHEYLRRRVTRLYVPFILWSAVYLALRLLKHRLTGTGSPIIFSPAWLLNGTAHHLWFLPFALLLSATCLPLGIWPRGLNHRTRTLVAGIFAVFAMGIAFVRCPVGMDPFANPVSYFIGLSWDSLPAAFLAVPIALSFPAVSPTNRCAIALVACLFLCAAMLFFGNHPATSALAGAALFVGLSKETRRPLPPWLVSVASLSFAVYLIHVAYVEALQVALHRVDLNASIGTDIFIVISGTLASVVTAFALKQVKLLRILV